MIQTGVEDPLSNEYNDSHDPGPQGEVGSDSDDSAFSDDGKFRQIDPETGTDLVAQFKQSDQNHIAELLGLYNGSSSEKFTDHYLVSRLAKANTCRRQQFGYWKMRRTKSELISQSVFLEKGDSVPVPARHDLQPQGGLEIPIAPIAPSQPSTATHLDVSKVKLDDEISIVSSSTVMHIGDTDNGDSYSIPPPPKGLWDRGDFECPYCFTLCPRRMLVKKSSGTHVLHDLRPYVCTYPNCKSEDQLYDTFTDWLNHETFTYFISFDTVINRTTEHRNATRDANDQSITEQMRDCPLCPMKAVDPIHVAAHLHRIACFALPRSVGDDDESDNGSQISGMAELILRGSSSLLTGSVHLSDSNDNTSMKLPAGPQLEDAQSSNPLSLESLLDRSFTQKDDEATMESYLKSMESALFNDREHLNDDYSKELSPTKTANKYAITWAVYCDVDIICIGWTIEATSPDSTEIQIINAAIATFSSKGIPNPGEADHCIKIGCASSFGRSLSWTYEGQLDFLVPGDEAVVEYLRISSSTYISGSSVATAAASGLAGLLLCCSRLVDAEEPTFFRSGQRMRNVFKALATIKPTISNPPQDSRYLDVEYYFGTPFKDLLRVHIPKEEHPMNITIHDVP
ncbi:uncharacterized protein KD926_007508 [Aspergillus affinis]|uniref:uncharacterized protein n=1 Tax=Aspergillus affinis TaxID=1070780 RepID=UPI0022FF1100|nr:uncharacterized protein KD926_007508 [Aspergillus affinis]KAI9040967.1 hypothetical protein KD926_007508 [Aspergillus affinis]